MLAHSSMLCLMRSSLPFKITQGLKILLLSPSSRTSFTDCCDYFGEEGCPPNVTIVPKGGTVVDPPPDSWGAWLTEAERHDKSPWEEE